MAGATPEWQPWPVSFDRLFAMTHVRTRVHELGFSAANMSLAARYMGTRTTHRGP